MTTKCFGISFKFKASVEVIILSLSKVMKGKLLGLEPVAIMVYLDSILSDEPSFLEILILVADSKLPKPSKTVTLFLSIKKLIPLVV